MPKAADDVISLQQELEECEEWRTHFGSRSEDLLKALMPFYRERKKLKAALIKTHHWGYQEDGNPVVLGLDLGNRAARVDMFVEMDELHRQSLPLRNEARFCRVKEREMTTRINHLKRIIQRQKPK